MDLSASKVDLYFSCQRKFLYQYVVKPILPPEKKAFVCGNVAHKALEVFHQKATPDNKNSWKEFMKSGIASAYKQYKVLENINNNIITKKDILVIRDILKLYISILETKKFPNIKFIEKFFKIKIDGITITGKADRIDQTSDSIIKIIDYKTSAAPFTKEYAYNSVQLPTYKLWLNTIYPNDINILGEYVYLKHLGTSKEKHTFAITDEHAQEAFEKYKIVDNHIKTKQNFIKNKEFKYCSERHCEYYDICSRED